MTHQKPTTEELQNGINSAIEEIEKPEEKPTETKEEEVIEKPKTEEKPEEKKEEVVVEKKEEKSEEKPTQEEIDYKKKFTESSREAQKIHAKNRKLNQAFDEANEMPEPTEEELMREFDGFDVMSDTEKKLAKESLISKRFREKIAKAREEGKRIEKWNEQVDEFVGDPKTLVDNPELEGKVDEFKLFATEESNNSVPFKVLVAAFLHEQERAKKPKQKGQMFETGTGGPNTNDTQKKKLSLEEGQKLMETNYDEYKRQLRAGNIESVVV